MCQIIHVSTDIFTTYTASFERKKVHYIPESKKFCNSKNCLLKISCTPPPLKVIKIALTTLRNVLGMAGLPNNGGDPTP